MLLDASRASAVTGCFQHFRCSVVEVFYKPAVASVKTTALCRYSCGLQCVAGSLPCTIPLLALLPSERYRSHLRFAHWIQFLNPASQTSTGEIHRGNSAIGEGPLNLYEEAWRKPLLHGQHAEQLGTYAKRGSCTVGHVGKPHAQCIAYRPGTTEILCSMLQV